MEKLDLPIPIHEIAFLQAYLYEVFTIEKHCENSFINSEWFLNEKYSKDKVELVKKYFIINGITCDCEIINKYDLKDFSRDLIKTHTNK